MTGQDLKNSILQLAIQGKLVPQCADDEPASKLLERIRKEKELLVKEKKIKKEKPLAPISEDEKPFEIPESWEWVRLGEVTNIARGGSPRPIKEYITDNPSGLNWIKIGDTDKGGKYINSTAEKIKPEGLVKTRKVYPGDFLLTNSMSFGRPYITNIEGCIHDGWLVISLIGGSYYSDFLYHILSSAFAKQQFGSKVAGAVVQNLNSDKVAESCFPLPPLAEQKRIVAKIEELMPFIEEYNKAQSELDSINKTLPERLKQSILQEAIMGKLGTNNPDDEPASELLARIRKEKSQLIKDKKIKKEKPLPEITDDEKPFEIPENWVWCRLGEMSNIINGFTPLRTNPEFWENGTINWFTVDDIHSQGRRIKETKQKINTNALSKDTKRIIPSGSLLLCCTASVGEYALNEIPLTTNQQFNGIVIKESYKNIISSEYLFSIAPMFKSWLLDLAGKTTFNFVSVKKVESIPIPLPPHAEQHRIVEKLDALLPKISELNKQ